MTLVEVTELLRMRSGFTSQPYGQGTVAEWHAALEFHDAANAIAALRLAARDCQTVSLADVLGRMGANRPKDPPGARYPEWCRCTDRSGEMVLCDDHRRIGLEAIARIRDRRQGAA